MQQSVTGRPASATQPQVDDVEQVDIDGVAMHVLTEAQTVQLVMAELERGQGGLLLTANVDIMYQLHAAPLLDIASKSRIVVPDGMPVVWSSALQGGTRLPERVTGADLVWSLSEEAARHGRRVFLLGAGPGVAERAAQSFVADCPGLQVVGFDSPPKGFDQDPEYMAGLVQRMQQVKPDIVFVALGFPKQELVSLQLLEHLPATWFMGCGAALDMAAGEVQRAHPLLQAAGVEWIHRLFLEPRRLARRYLVHDVPYAFGLMGRSLLRRVGGRA